MCLSRWSDWDCGDCPSQTGFPQPWAVCQGLLSTAGLSSHVRVPALGSLCGLWQWEPP